MKGYIAIIDYKLSNMFSVKHALDYLGAPCVITSDPKVVIESDAAILPGVGAFGDAMKNLNHFKLSSVIREFVSIGKPMLGVCLGMQLLFTKSEEFGLHRGLDLISGSVVKIPSKNTSGILIPVPNIGWNKILPDCISWRKTLLLGIDQGSYMYFVHSYIVKPEDKRNVLCTTTYCDVHFCSGISNKNITAVQFHPEKSGSKGLAIYRNFIQSIT